MATTTASSIRPSLRENRQPSGSPHTPTSRFISSNYSSPGSTFRQEEDAVIIELDPRFLKAGFEGESGPQCVLPFTPAAAKRVGDYRQWLPGYKGRRATLEDSVSGYELWRDNLGTGTESLDIGLLEDKLERAVRDAYNSHLLTDAGTARLVLVLPSLLPHPILSAILTLLFSRWKHPSIALMPRPTCCLAAAGLRSGIVVDIGWEETTVTPIYEYRELRASRSIRGMKMLTTAIGQTLRTVAEKHAAADGKSLQLDLDFVEDVVMRVARCPTIKSSEDTPADNMANVSIHDQSTIALDWPTNTSSISLALRESDIATVVHDSFLHSDQLASQPDDEELPLDKLLYTSLLHLPPDVRAVCISRLTFVGTGSSIPGLKQNTLHSLEAEIAKHGWTSVRGTHITQQRRHNLSSIAAQNFATTPPDMRYDTILPPGKDYVEEKLQQQRHKENQNQQQGAPVIQGRIRAVDSLGAWAGASLLASLKVKGVVEIERNKFLDHGMAGASREHEISVVPQRISSYGAAKTGERSSWTLGSWG